MQENLQSYFSGLDQVSVPSNGHHQHEEAQRLGVEKQKQTRIKMYFSSPPPPHANLLLPPLLPAPLWGAAAEFHWQADYHAPHHFFNPLNVCASVCGHLGRRRLQTSPHPDAPLHHVCVRAGRRRFQLTSHRINSPLRQSRLKHFNQSKRTPTSLSLFFFFACKSNFNHPPYERRLWK